MGVYDRDYFRKEGPSYLDSLGLPGQACKWLLFCNIGLFILQLITQTGRLDLVSDYLALKPSRVLTGEVWRLLTYAFLHNPHTWTHIFFNMWLLWLIGRYLEEHYGQWEFLAFYLAAATVGGLAFVAQAALGFHLDLDTPCLGASGAITALLILCAFNYPNKTIMVFFILPVPIWALAVLQVALDSFGLLSGSADLTPTAFSVHLGGAAFAALYFLGHWQILRTWNRFRTWKGPRRRPRLRIFPEERDIPEPVPVAATPHGENTDKQLEAMLDAVLEKVTRSGQASLTEAEKQILLRASQIYKKRRT